MSPAQLLLELSRLGFTVTPDGDRVRLRGPRGVITQALRDDLARHRDALRAMVTGTDAAHMGSTTPHGGGEPLQADEELTPSCAMRDGGPRECDPTTGATRAEPSGSEAVEPPALAHRRRLGWSLEQFGMFCRRLIGKPGPSTWDEDCRVAAELARIPTPTTTSACSVTTRAEERPLRGGPAIAADTVPTHEVSLLSVANRYRAAFGTSMVAALREVTGCDFNDRNPTREELMRFSAWLDASTLRSVVGTEASSIPRAGNAEEGNP